jgi:hypothetical protein
MKDAMKLTVIEQAVYRLDIDRDACKEQCRHVELARKKQPYQKARPEMKGC